MSNIINSALFGGVIAFILGLLVTPIVIKLAWKFNIVDDPKKHKHAKVIHTYPVPRAGGLAIFIAIAIPTLFLLPLDKHLFGILGGLVVLLVMGILDDKYDLPPYPRLLVQFIAAGIPIAAGIGIAFITNPQGGIIDLSHPQITFMLLGKIRTVWILSDLFALFWIVTIINFLNWGAKGVDGQLPGVTVVAAITIALLSLGFVSDPTQIPVIILASITAGAYLGFLPWNFYPQKIMPAFSGANIAGFMLAVLSIMSTTKVGTLLVVLGVPLVDSGYTLIRRIASGKSPFWGDRGHLHHKLLEAGLSKRQVASLYWLFSAILGAAALSLNTTFKFYTIIFIVFLVGGVLLLLTYRQSK
jgi:UDP-GlcNAc:undecaprenyl-phosphate GlcNAc-1-phosphate transferase